MEVKMFLVEPWKLIICKMEDETPESRASGYYNVEDPYILEVVKIPEGITYMPLPLIFTDGKYQKYRINKDKVIVAPFTAPAELEAIYLQNTSTIIQSAAENKLIY